MTHHVIIIDGTQSRLSKGHETNAGLLYKLLSEAVDKKETVIWYDEGVQGKGFWKFLVMASGMGINHSIRDAYAQLSSRYRKGDKIYLFGYSRGAYAVRSLAGMITKLGLLRYEQATQRNVMNAFRIYERKPPEKIRRAFCYGRCHHDVKIELIGLWDTVKALGIPYPILSRLAPMATEFHNDRINASTRFAFHALARDESRTDYKPVMWNVSKDWGGVMEQVWFKGAHGDIGGHLDDFQIARGISNIALIWMVDRIETHTDLRFPQGWRARFPTDKTAPGFGDNRGIARLFIFRARRILGLYPHEYLHHTAVREEDSFGEDGAEGVKIPIKTDDIGLG